MDPSNISSSVPIFEISHITSLLQRLLTYDVPSDLKIISPYLDPPTETSYYPISVTAETPIYNLAVMTSLLLRIYSKMKPTVIPSLLTL